MFLCFFTCMCLNAYIIACASPGPFYSALQTSQALNEIAEHRSQVEALIQEESTILHGLGFFKIEQTPFKAIRTLEKV